MKSKLKILTSIIATGALVMMLSVSQAQTTISGTASSTSSSSSGNRGSEHHPEIRAAIRALERAREDLQKAAHDFGGHREAALKACDEAIKQLREALEYDKK